MSDYDRLADLIVGHARVLASLILMSAALHADSAVGWVTFVVAVLLGIQGLSILRQAS